MDQMPDTRIIFDLFESSGIGLVGIGDDNRVLAANPNVGVYLGLEPEEIIGRDAGILRAGIRSEEFWAAFPGTFYCLAPGPHNLLLTVSRRLGPEHGSRLRRAIILRPYSLEREFGRMRVFLNNFLAHEVASRLNSIGIASEFITEPELRESDPTREAFLSTFRHDVGELNSLFVQLLETAEQLAIPNRLMRSPVDWAALVADLAAKIKGLASERSVGLSCTLPPHLPSAQGDYHWLYLGLYGVLAEALDCAAPLTEVDLAARTEAGRMLTEVVVRRADGAGPIPWPPPALFPLDDAHPRIGRLRIDDLAVTRAIFLLHGGDLQIAPAGDGTAFVVSLPA